MPIQIQIGPVLGSLAPATVGIETLLQMLRGRGTPEAQALADALYELQMGIATLEAILREPIPVEGEGITLTNPRGEATDYFQPGGLYLQDPAAGGASILLQADGTPAAVVQAKQNLSIVWILANAAGGSVLVTDNAGGVQVELDGSVPEIRINGNRVVGARQAAEAAVTQTAGGTYTATEQAMLNALKTAVNGLITKLSSASGHGLLT